jgi:hypothetical protein
VTNEAFARVKIDQLLKDTESKLTDGRSVRFEHPLDDGGKAEYAPFDSWRRTRAMFEAKSQECDRQADTWQHWAEGATLKELAQSYNVRMATISRLAA